MNTLPQYEDLTLLETTYVTFPRPQEMRTSSQMFLSNRSTPTVPLAVGTYLGVSPDLL